MAEEFADMRSWLSPPVCIPQILAISDVMECRDYTEIHSTRIFLGRENGLTFPWSL